jgi:hypothetical protein
LGDNAHFRRKIHLAEILMLLKSLSRQPLTKYGVQYLKFVTRNIVRNTSRFSEVIRYAIIGHHFHIITQETLKIDQVATDLENCHHDFCEYISSCSDAARENSRAVIQQTIDFWNVRTRILEDIKTKIDHVHEDFREDLRKRYAEVALGMKEHPQAMMDLIKDRDRGISASM